jgi:hypothetical protein
MAYVIDRYNGTTLTTVEDGTIDTTLDIRLVGKNYAGYGEVQNENFLHLLENFSGESKPPRPISGQLWYDSLSKKVKFYNGTNSETGWKAVSGANVQSGKPTGCVIGDFWWDSGNKQLYAHDGTDFVVVGPQAAPGLGTTQMLSKTVLDDVGVAHAITEAIVDNGVVFVISSDEFVLGDVNPILGFSRIKQGITLVNTGSDGVTTSSHRYWGTASNALSLNGISASNFVTRTNGSFLNSATFADAGFTVGDSGDLIVNIQNGSDAYIKNSIGNTIYFQTTASGTQTPMIFNGANILPGVDVASNIGSSSYRYNYVYASAFKGTADQSDALSVNGVYRTAAVSTAGTGQANTIACRDSSGNLNATYFQGIATSALFADLAEKYLPDQAYEVGTVVAVGGSAEVTACKQGDRAFGAVSANPAFKMNDGLVGGTYIALKGRVPIKVVGPVEKGDKLVAADNGCAGVAHIYLKGQSINSRTFPDTFAIALESNSDDGIKLVECVIL